MKKILLSMFFLIFLGSFLFKQNVREFLRQRYPSQFSIDKLALDVQTDLTNDVGNSLYPHLKGPFKFLGNGVQAIAFVDSTDTYVLKLFLLKGVHGEKKIPKFQPMRWIGSYKNTKKQKLVNKRQRRLFRGLEAYDHVFKYHRDIAGINAVHLNSCEGDLPVVELLDENGASHFVNLNKAIFVIQKKATLVLPFLSSKNFSEKKHYLDLMNEFLIKKTRLGYKDLEKELQMHKNYGFIDGVPVQIDVGALRWAEMQSIEALEEEKNIQAEFLRWKLDSGLNFVENFN